MSLGEGIEIKKDGGAHNTNHETFSGNCLPLSEQYMASENLTGSKNPSVAVKLEPQDGGQKSSASENDESGIGENLPFLPELGTDCLDSYDSAVVENNTEWLKARCKNFGQIEFDITPNSAGDDTLDFAGITLDSKGIGQPANNDSAVKAKADAVSVISKSVTQGAQYATPYLTLSGANIADNDTSWQTFTVQNGELQRSEPASECTEYNLNIGDIDMNFLKSNLGIKDGVLTLFSNDVGNEALQESHADSDMPIENDAAIAIPVNHEQQKGIPLVGTVVLNPENSTGATSLSENLALTTISIATDKQSNSTKILVDTSQGRQLYHLNISELKKLQNGMVANNNSQKTDNPSAAVNIPSKKSFLNCSYTFNSIIQLFKYF